MKAISLFSGIGAFELAAQFVFGDAYGGLRLRYQTFQFVEIDVKAQRVLRSHFPNIPIWSDIRSYHPPEPGKPRSVARHEAIRFPTIIVGGFPCTDTSSAGKREGLSGNESGLWWEMYRIIIECQPDFVIIENPEGIVHRGLRTILGALRVGGYQREIEIISAAEFGAPHQRNRLFIIAYPTTYPSSNGKGGNAGQNKLETTLRSQNRLSPTQKLSPTVCAWMMGFPPGWTESILMDGGGETYHQLSLDFHLEQQGGASV